MRLPENMIPQLTIICEFPSKSPWEQFYNVFYKTFYQPTYSVIFDTMCFQKQMQWKLAVCKSCSLFCLYLVLCLIWAMSTIGPPCLYCSSGREMPLLARNKRLPCFYLVYIRLNSGKSNGQKFSFPTPKLHLLPYSNCFQYTTLEPWCFVTVFNWTSWSSLFFICM